MSDNFWKVMFVAVAGLVIAGLAHAEYQPPLDPKAATSECGDNASLSELRSQMIAVGFEWTDTEINAEQARRVALVVSPEPPEWLNQVHYFGAYYGGDIPQGKVVVGLFDADQCFLGAALADGDLIPQALSGTGI